MKQMRGLIKYSQSRQAPWDLLWLDQLGLPVLLGSGWCEDKGSLCLEKACSYSTSKRSMKCRPSVQATLRWFQEGLRCRAVPKLAHRARVTARNQSLSHHSLPEEWEGVLSIGVRCIRGGGFGTKQQDREVKVHLNLL